MGARMGYPWNTDIIVFWAWVPWSTEFLRTRSSEFRRIWMRLCFGHECCGHRMSDVLERRTLLHFGHVCSGHRMFLEQGHYCCFGMLGLVIGSSWNAVPIMVWARVVWASEFRITRMLLWFRHGCSGHQMFFEHGLYSGLAAATSRFLYYLKSTTPSWILQNCRKNPWPEKAVCGNYNCHC